MNKKIPYIIARILLGIVFILSGITKFFPMPMPEGTPQAAIDFTRAMANTGYFIPFLGIAEVFVGVLLVFNLWVPLSMMILSPIMLNIILFSLFLSPSLAGLLFVGILLLLQIYIMYKTRDNYKPLLSKRIN